MRRISQREFLYLSFLFLLPLGGLSSCEEESPTISNPTELITTFIYILTPENGGDNVVLSYEDLDGEGGNPPSYLTEPIPANTTFNGVIQALDKTQSPIEDVTPELKEEDKDHQIFFSPTNIDVSIRYEDSDDDGNPVGLATTFISGDPGTGTLKITLRHKPKKFAEGVSGGDITNAEGEKDVEANFPITIQ